MRMGRYALATGVVAAALVVVVRLETTTGPAPIVVETGPVKTAVTPSARFGITAVDPQAYDLASLGAGFYLNWTATPAPGVMLEFIPMICAYPGAAATSDAALSAWEAEIRRDRTRFPSGTLWVIGNEIGYRQQYDAREPDVYVEDFERCRTMLARIDPTFRVAVGPAILSEDESIARDYVGEKGALPYLDAVLKAYATRYGEPIPAAFFSATAHVVEDRGVDATRFAEQIVRYRRFLAERGLRDRGLLITEYGVPLGPAPKNEVVTFLKDATRFLDTARDPEIGCPHDDNRLVQRWAWFTAHSIPWWRKLSLLGLNGFNIHFDQTSLFDANGATNELGQAYREAVRNSLEADARGGKG